MKVPIYERQVTSISMPTVRVQDSSGPAAASSMGIANAMGDLGKGMAQVATQINDAQIIQQEKINKMSVMDKLTSAKDELNSTYFGQNGLLSLKGENALGKEAINGQGGALSVAQNSEKTIKFIKGNYRDSLSNDAQKDVFSTMFDQEASTYQKAAYIHEQEQTNVALQNTTTAAVDTWNRSFQNHLAVGDRDAADGDLRRIMLMKSSINKTQGLNDEENKVDVANLMNKIVSHGIIATAQSGDSVGAKKHLDWYTDKVDGNARQEIMGQLKPILAQNTAYNFVENLKNNADFYTNGIFDEPKAMDRAREMLLNKTKSVTIPGTPGTPSGGGTYESFKKALLVQESGDYDSPSNKFGASGAYQMTPATVKSGLRVLGLPEDTHLTPDIQDKVADALLKPLYEKYGVKGASVAWYAGDQNAPRILAGQNPIGDNGNEYSADAKQDDGTGNLTAPSVNEYAASILSRVGGGTIGGTEATTQQVADPDFATFKMVEQQIREAAAESSSRHKQSIDNSMSSFDQWLTVAKPTSFSTIEAKAKELGFQGADLINAVAKGQQYAGLLKVEENQNTNELVEGALGKMYRGEITTPGELDTQYGGSIPYSKLIMLGNSLKKETKWATAENLMAFNGVLADKKIKGGTEKSAIFEKINQQVASNLAKGIPITSGDISDWTEEQTQKIIIGRSWYGKSNKIDLAYVPSGWNVTADGVFDTNGVKVTKYENNKFYTNINGVDIEIQP